MVIGRVVSLHDAGIPALSEHAPDYWVAALAVTHAPRGGIAADQVDVLFMNSHDVRWHEAPKPRAGETALWLLHATEGEERELAAWRVVHPEDRQPAESLDLLRAERSSDL
jgi:hypothetical protein